MTEGEFGIKEVVEKRHELVYGLSTYYRVNANTFPRISEGFAMSEKLKSSF